jgi:hypothetical protein
VKKKGGTTTLLRFLKRRVHLLLLLVVVISHRANAQEKEDTTRHGLKDSKAIQKIMGIITKDPGSDQATINEKSEKPYLPHAGKIIRRIIVRRIGFNNTVQDTSSNVQTFLSKAANSMHVDTREFVVRDNLFIKEGQPLNPYRVADNERILRNLNFVKDARILVRPVKNSNQVDLIVITRDVFSLGASFTPDGATRYRFSVQEANLLGMGQSLQVGGQYDIDRTPKFGSEIIYQKINVLGTFVNSTIGYSQINGGTSLGTENESAVFLRLARPLFHPFTRWAGGIEISNNFSTNVFRRPDSLYENYRYIIQDYWAGYSFGFKTMPNNLRENRNRRFVALRSYQQNFSELPNGFIREIDRYALRTRQAILGQVSFFRQDFYKTQYVVGFGRTEDIPYGYRVSFTGGVEKELGNQRTYGGTEVYFSNITANGAIHTYYLGLGGYYNPKTTAGEDGIFIGNFQHFSQLHRTGTKRVRLQTSIGYARIYNQTLKRGIDVRDINGILGFSPDSLVGNNRLTLSEEAVMYTPWRILGFKLAPIARIDVAMLSKDAQLFKRDNFFSGISAGIRTRNENLIFNTIEARIFYYPRVVENVSHVGFRIQTNLRIRYPTALVNAPSTLYNPSAPPF